MGTEIDKQKRGKRAAFNIKSFPPYSLQEYQYCFLNFLSSFPPISLTLVVPITNSLFNFFKRIAKLSSLIKSNTLDNLQNIIFPWEYSLLLCPSQMQFLSRPIQFSSIHSLSCVRLCDPMNRRTSGLPVHHQLPESTQLHVHWVGDAIQPSHPLLFPSPPALSLSQHQGLFKWVSSLHHVAKVLECQLVILDIVFTIIVESFYINHIWFLCFLKPMFLLFIEEIHSPLFIEEILWKLTDKRHIRGTFEIKLSTYSFFCHM